MNFYRAIAAGFLLVGLLSTGLRAQSVIGAGPFYKYEVVAEAGMTIGADLTVTDAVGVEINHGPAVEQTFTCNDRGDVVCRVAIQVPTENPGRTLQRYLEVLAARDSDTLRKVGEGHAIGSAVTDDRSIISRNRVYVGGLDVPVGYLCEERFDPYTGVQYGCSAGFIGRSTEAAHNGDLYFNGGDFRLSNDGGWPWHIFKVDDPYATPVLASSVYVLETNLWNNGLWTPRFEAGDNGCLLIGDYRNSQFNIVVRQPNGDTRTVASEPAFEGIPSVSLSPGLSGDGLFFAYARRDPSGTALFVGQTAVGAPFSTPQPVISTYNVIGLNGTNGVVHFKDFDGWRVAILHHDVGSDRELNGDTLWLVFAASTDDASRDNPQAPGKPLLFRRERGIWAMRVDIQREVGGSNLMMNACGPMAVIQLGDLFRGEEIQEVDAFPSLYVARGTMDESGASREPKRNDHVAVFRIRTATTTAIIRAVHLDDDEDGLPNHWEDPGEGIDADRDGMPDLELARFGADRRHKDLFLEVDWTSPNETEFPGGWVVGPEAATIQAVVARFANAPVQNPDGSTGIRLHVDCGPGADIHGIPFTAVGNTGGAGGSDLQGGDEVLITGARPDVVTLGGGHEAGRFGPFVVTPLDAVKEAYFGTADKWAREYAFRYAMYCDFAGFASFIPTGAGWRDRAYMRVGGARGTHLTVSLSRPVTRDDLGLLNSYFWIGIGSGAIRGEVRKMVSDVPGGLEFTTNAAGSVTGFTWMFDSVGFWTPPTPGDTVYLFNGRILGEGESFWRSVHDAYAAENNPHRLGGNDLISSQAIASFLGGPLEVRKHGINTLTHELGHNLGLTHGGAGVCEYEGLIHWSLMSYSHVNRMESNAFIMASQPACTDELQVFPPPPELASYGNPPGVVDNYSDGQDPMQYNEWEHLRLETWSVPWYLGNSGFHYAAPLPPIHPVDLPVPEYLEDRDHEPPQLAWQLPAPPLRTLAGTLFTNEFTATDNVAVVSLTVAFDANGDGETNGPAESVAPVALGANRFRAVFATTGPDGVREVVARAQDAAGNVAQLNPYVMVGAAAVPDTDPPWIQAVNPYAGVTLPGSGMVPVEFRSVETPWLADFLRAEVRFDVDGNGSIDPVTEVFDSVEAQDSYHAGARIAWLSQVEGLPGNRALTITAWDRWLNSTSLTFAVVVAPTDLVAPVVTLGSVPEEGAPVEYGALNLTLQAAASDAGGIKQMSWVLDADGDGVIDQVFSTERVRYFYEGANTNEAEAMLLQTSFTGPAGVRTLLVSATDNAGNVGSVTRTLILMDRTPPVIVMEAPGDGDPVRLGAPLRVTGLARDEDHADVVRVTLDADGNGVEEPGETVSGLPAADGSFTNTLPTLSGPEGLRRLRVEAVDRSGNVAFVEYAVRAGEGVLILAPQAGDAVPVGATLLASVELVPAETPEARRVRYRFDVNGDGDTADAGEDQDAPVETPAVDTEAAPLPRAVAVLGSVSGPAGPRTLTIVEQGGGGGSTANVSVVVESLPLYGVSERLAHLPWTTALTNAYGDGHAVPRPVGALGNVVFFTALTEREGLELWRTDGTPAGTFLLRDIDPGFFEGLNAQPAGSAPSDFAVFSNRMFFAASEQPGQTLTATIGSGRELWSSDGTPSGTALFKDINPGRLYAQTSDSSDPRFLTVFGGKLWFVADDGAYGKRLWRSDGTVAGTLRWVDSPLLSPGYVTTPGMVAAGALLYVVSDNGRSLWRTDGTAGGTFLLVSGAAPPPPAPTFIKLVPADSRLYLLATSAAGYELWTSDGSTNGTQKLRVLAPLASAAGAPELAALGSRAVFACERPAEGREVWISDGTAVGTQLLKDMWPGGTNAFGQVASGYPRELVSLGTSVLFSGLSTNAGDEPWITDGTTVGTRVLADLTRTAWASRNSAVPPGSAPEQLTPGTTGAWWSAGDDKRRYGHELWRWDGTGAPSRVRDIAPLYVARSLGSGLPYYGPASALPTALLATGGRLFFRATDPLYGDELFVSDGTAAGTRRLRNLAARVGPATVLARTNSVMLAGYDGLHARLLEAGDGVRRAWLSSDRQAAGAPKQLQAFGAGVAFILPSQDEYGYAVEAVHVWPDGSATPTNVLAMRTILRLAAHNEWLWIAGINDGGWPVLLRTDGNSQELVAGLDGTLAETSLLEFKPDGARLFFTASVTDDRELWLSDSNGIRRVLSASGPAPHGVEGLTKFGGAWYFTGIHSNVFKVWRTDGTDAGTAVFGDGRYEAAWFEPRVMPVVLNGRLLFSALARIEPVPPWNTLWSTDGTAGNTRELGRLWTDGGAEFQAQQIKWLTVAGGRAFFSALSSFLGEELWITDGTSNGTTFVKNIQPRVPDPNIWWDPDSSPDQITPLGSNILFVAGTLAAGRELWFSDGTSNGTRLVREIFPGVNAPGITDMTAVGSRVYFTARTPENGRELWASDGTSNGTALVEDVAPGPTGADPARLTVAGGKLYYLAARDGDDVSLRRISGVATPYEQWLGKFALPSGFDRQPGADGDGDSWPNEWEFWFGTSPTDRQSAQGFDGVGVQFAATTATHLTFQYRRPANWQALGLQFEFFGDNAVMPRTPLTVEHVSATVAGAFETVTLRIPIGEETRWFIRMKVSRP